MAAVEIESFDALKQMADTPFPAGEWVTVTQEMIDAFATATRDDQWIHTDPVRAAAQSPFGTTVAHGFLSLSMVPAMIEAAVTLKSRKMGVNYGMDRVRFPSPVPVNSRVRLHCRAGQIEEMESGGLKVVWYCEVELEGSPKPACVCDLISVLFE